MSINVTKKKIIAVHVKKAKDPSQKEHARFYPQLNGLRFIFIFFVLLHHWGPETIFKVTRIGWLGVDLFFVLSGFLIGEILIIENERKKNKLLGIKNLYYSACPAHISSLLHYNYRLQLIGYFGRNCSLEFNLLK